MVKCPQFSRSFILALKKVLIGFLKFKSVIEICQEKFIEMGGGGGGGVNHK
jgi:hypothetical protein